MILKPCSLPWTPRKTLVAFDLFSGIGGASEGLVRAGFETAGWDEDFDAVNTYRANVGVCGHGPIAGAHPPADLQVVWADLPQDGYRARLVAFPSVEKGGSTWHAVRVMLEARAQCGVFMWSAKRFYPHKPLIELVASSGYTVRCERVNLADYGLPQLRKYDVIVAWRTKKQAEAFAWPERTYCDPRLSTFGKKPWTAVEDVLDGIPYPYPSPRVTKRELAPRPRSKDRAYAARVMADHLGGFAREGSIRLSLEALRVLQGIPLEWRLPVLKTAKKTALVTTACPPVFGEVMGREIVRVLHPAGVARAGGG